MNDKKALKDKLSPEQFSVMCESGTEPAFKNKYWDNHEPGIYVNAVTGEPLFSSLDKFDSGTGWPSFTKPISSENVVEKKDKSHGMERTEARSKEGDFHLGHVFNDGPKPAGARYCINSASLRFIPVNRLEKEGYGKYVVLFEAAEKAAFAGGCFWGTEFAFSQIKGVKKVLNGYMGGSAKNPTYKDVSSGATGHAEAVFIEYDPAQVSYEKLLGEFWNMHDPTTLNRQGPDVGSQYRSVIFYYTPQQEKAARASKEKLEKSGKFKSSIVTEIVPAGEFYKAEEYHQQYFKKRGIKPKGGASIFRPAGHRNLTRLHNFRRNGKDYTAY